MTGETLAWARGYTIVDSCERRSMAYEQLDPEIGNGLRNADPTVWPVLDSVAALYRANRARLEPHRDHVGMIHYGSAYPKAIAQRVIADMSRNGRVSPAAFINANAGAALSICCTRFGFRGPTMNLTMPAASARTLVDVLAARWLGQGSARYLILVAADFEAAADIRVTGTLIRRLDLG
jgi:hypothetical protein